MLNLSVECINKVSPYYVTSDKEDTFVFDTDQCVKYEVSFVKDYTLGIENSYQLCITNIDKKTQPRDAKVRDTVVAIVEEFFKNNELSLLYICDSSDGRQRVRNRIFRIWFEEKATGNLYTLIPASIMVDNEEYFASLILCKSNPLHDEILSIFTNFTDDLADKWND